MLIGHGFDDPLRDYYALVRQIRQYWPGEDEAPSDELMTLIERAVTKCPHMSDLWLWRADLIRRRGPDSPYTDDDLYASLEAAVRIDPDAAEVHEALGAFCEEDGDLDRAEQAYARAVELKGGPWAYTALARILAKQDRMDEAFAALDEAFCPFHDEPGIIEARQRLESGETEF